MLILDSDALIKLNLAGLLDRVAQVYECVIPMAVYQEAEEDALGTHPDAAEILDIVNNRIEVVKAEPFEGFETPSAFGPGEIEILLLVTPRPPGPKIGVGVGLEATVVTDDVRVLRYLAALGVNFMVPSSVIVTMRQQDYLSHEETISIIETLRPVISSHEYLIAIQALEQGE